MIMHVSKNLRMRAKPEFRKIPNYSAKLGVAVLQVLVCIRCSLHNSVHGAAPMFFTASLHTVMGGNKSDFPSEQSQNTALKSPPRFADGMKPCNGGCPKLSMLCWLPNTCPSSNNNVGKVCLGCSLLYVLRPANLKECSLQELQLLATICRLQLHLVYMIHGAELWCTY